MMVLEQEKKDHVMHALADHWERKILLSTAFAAKSVEEIAKEQEIPISTCYRRVHEMVATKLLRIERTIITDDGKKYETFRSAIKCATVSFSSDGEMFVEVTLLPRDQEEPSGKLQSLNAGKMQLVSPVG